VKKILFTITLMLIGVFSLVFFAEPVKAQEQNQDIVNLASPDLEGKEYLGNGVYRLINSTYTLDYNIYNGYLIFNGSFNEATTATIVSTGTNKLDTYTIKLTEISGTKTINNNNILLTFNSGTTAVFTNVNSDSGYTDTFTYNYVRLYFGLAGVFDNYTVKLQLEKGNTATDYQVPIQALEQHIQFEQEPVDVYVAYYLDGVEDISKSVYLNLNSGSVLRIENNDWGDNVFMYWTVNGAVRRDLAQEIAIRVGNDLYLEAHFLTPYAYNIYQDGYNDGYYVGYGGGYDVGYNDGYIDGSNHGYDVGYDYGYDHGYDKGLVENPDNNFGTMIRTVLLGVGSILSVQLLPNITIGAIIAVPIIFGIISFVLGRRKD